MRVSEINYTALGVEPTQRPRSFRQRDRIYTAGNRRDNPMTVYLIENGKVSSEQTRVFGEVAQRRMFDLQGSGGVLGIENVGSSDTQYTAVALVDDTTVIPYTLDPMNREEDYKLARALLRRGHEVNALNDMLLQRCRPQRVAFALDQLTDGRKIDQTAATVGARAFYTRGEAQLEISDLKDRGILFKGTGEKFIEIVDREELQRLAAI